METNKKGACAIPHLKKDVLLRLFLSWWHTVGYFPKNRSFE